MSPRYRRRHRRPRTRRACRTGLRRGCRAPKPFVIGLTGNIATGKSTVAKRLGELGARVIDADLVYRDLIEPGQPGFDAVVALFGSAIVDDDGRIDRRKLGEIVFRDAEALRRLEQVTHPLVHERVVEILEHERPRIAVHEAIKLIESGAADRCDSVWVVTAPRDLQIERLMSSRGLSRADAELRVDAQPLPAEKVERADVVLTNHGDLDALRRQVDEAWSKAVP